MHKNRPDKVLYSLNVRLRMVALKWSLYRCSKIPKTPENSLNANFKIKVIPKKIVMIKKKYWMKCVYNIILGGRLLDLHAADGLQPGQVLQVHLRGTKWMHSGGIHRKGKKKARWWREIFIYKCMYIIEKGEREIWKRYEKEIERGGERKNSI